MNEKKTIKYYTLKESYENLREKYNGLRDEIKEMKKMQKNKKKINWNNLTVIGTIFILILLVLKSFISLL